jgi:hypothetical protein
MEFFLEKISCKTLNIFYNLKIKYHRPLFWNVEHTKRNHCLSTNSNPSHTVLGFYSTLNMIQAAKFGVFLYIAGIDPRPK